MTSFPNFGKRQRKKLIVKGLRETLAATLERLEDVACWTVVAVQDAFLAQRQADHGPNGYVAGKHIPYRGTTRAAALALTLTI
jgi:hypothetical protein